MDSSAICARWGFRSWGMRAEDSGERARAAREPPSSSSVEPPAGPRRDLAGPPCARPPRRTGSARRAVVTFGGMNERFHRFAWRVSERVGSPHAFVAAILIVGAWALTGPMFHFSDAWQLVINTGTTIVTFLMVFLIQATQNRDGRATQLKLDELIRSQKRARNLFADLEHATDEELAEFEREFVKIRARASAREAAKAEKATQGGSAAPAGNGGSR